jgi:hypothetical protein
MSRIGLEGKGANLPPVIGAGPGRHDIGHATQFVPSREASKSMFQQLSPEGETR